MTSSFPILIHFISSSCLITLARNSKTMLIRTGGSEQPCLPPDFNGNSYSCCPFSMKLALCLSFIAFIMLRNIPLFLVSSEILSWRNVRFCQRFFLFLLSEPCGFCPSFCLYDVLCLFIYICWTIFGSLE
jgi:hypothetical protein